MRPIIYVTKVEDLPDLSHAQDICVDFETDSGVPQHAEADPWRNARICLIGISDFKTIWVVATKRCKRPTLFLPALDTASVLTWLRATLTTKRTSYVGHWIRAEANLARADACALNRETFWFCTEIGLHHENDCFEEFNLKWAAETLCELPLLKQKEDELLNWLAQSKLGTRSKPGNYAEVPTDLLGYYCALDVEASCRLRDRLVAQLDDKQKRAFTQDCEVNKVFHDMQYRGVLVDMKKTMLAKWWYLHELQAHMEILEGVTGKIFNPGSAIDLASLLLNTYKLPVVAWTKDKSKEKSKVQREVPSFDEDALQTYLKLPEVAEGRIPGIASVIYSLLKYRECTKILGYLDNFLENDTRLGFDGRVHGNIHPCRARGGRTTSNNPNLQNFPMEAKEFLIPDPGFAFFNADASQIEYRFMAHYMRDVRLLEGFKDRTFDQHEAVKQWMGLEDRDQAKVFNFGIAFNMGAEKIARTYSIQLRASANPRTVTLEEGLDVFKRYTTELPYLLPTRRMFAETARTYGYVRNVFGRKAYLEPDKSYKAFNRGNQGGAADLIKNRMIAVDAYVRSRNLLDAVQILLMVHDELVIQIAGGTPLSILGDILDILEGFDELRVPIFWDSAYCMGSWKDVAICKKDKKSRPAQKIRVGKHVIKTFEVEAPRQ